jgi:hypothetical protein
MLFEPRGNASLGETFLVGWSSLLEDRGSSWLRRDEEVSGVD